MTEPEAKAIAERICDEMWREWGMVWMADSRTGEPVERDAWIEKIAAALMGREEK